LYSYDEIPNLPPGARLLPGSLIVPEREIFTMRKGTLHEDSFGPFSNVFRYKLLLERGGWWVDLDVVCIKPFDFSAEWVFASERRQKGGLLRATCAMKAPPGSDMVAWCYERSRSHKMRDRRWAVIGPHLVHAAVKKYNLTPFIVPADFFCPIDWWHARSLLEPGEIPSSYAVHLWNEAWRTDHWSQDPIYPPEVLYQRLHTLYPPALSADRNASNGVQE